MRRGIILEKKNQDPVDFFQRLFLKFHAEGARVSASALVVVTENREGTVVGW